MTGDGKDALTQGRMRKEEDSWTSCLVSQVVVYCDTVTVLYTLRVHLDNGKGKGNCRETLACALSPLVLRQGGLRSNERTATSSIHLESHPRMSWAHHT